MTINNNFDISVKRFDEFAEEYAKRFNKIDSYLPSIDLFCDSIPTDKPSILELACGPGNVTKHLQQKFPDSKLVAIDLAPKMIEIAKDQIKNVDFRVMDVRDIFSIDQHFDAIMCAFCLPFLSKEDTEKLISDCAGKLSPNGVIYISTMEGDQSKAGFETTSFSGESRVYFNYHMQADIENTLKRNGFQIESIKRQDYHEPDGNITIDLIFVAKKL